VYNNTRGQLAALINVHAANCAFSTTKSTACMYAATYTRLTVRHVYSDCTRDELQVAKSSVFCSSSTQSPRITKLKILLSLVIRSTRENPAKTNNFSHELKSKKLSFVTKIDLVQEKAKIITKIET